MLSVWQRLMDVAQDMERDPEFLLDVDYFVFQDVSDVITDSCRNYRQTKVSEMITHSNISGACDHRSYMHV